MMKTKKDGSLSLSIQGNEQEAVIRNQRISVERQYQILAIVDQKEDGTVSVVNTDWMERRLDEIQGYQTGLAIAKECNESLAKLLERCLPALEQWADSGTDNPAEAQQLLNTVRDLRDTRLTLSKPPTTH